MEVARPFVTEGKYGNDDVEDHETGIAMLYKTKCFALVGGDEGRERED